MKLDSDFSLAVRQLRRHINLRHLLHLASILIAAALGLSLTAAAGQKSGWLPWHGFWVHAGLILISAAGVWIYHMKIRRDFIEVLIDMDERMHLKDLISTAYVLNKQPKNSPFIPHLLQDAAEHLREIDPSKVFPFKFSLLHALIFIFTAALFVTVQYDFPGSEIPRVNSAAPKVPPALPPMEDDRSETWMDSAPQTPEKKIENLALAVESGSIGPDDIAETVRTLFDEVQASQARTAQHLSEALMGHGFSDAVNSSLLDAAIRSEKGMAQLNEEIRRHFQKNIPESVKTPLKEMEKNKKSIQRLQEISSEDLTKDDINAQTSLKSKKMPPLAPEKIASAAIPSENPDKKSRAEPANAMPPEATDASRHSVDRSGVEKNEETQSTADDKNSAGAAGVAKPRGTEKKPSEIETATGPGISEKGEVTNGSHYKISIKAHSPTGSAPPPTAPIDRAYQQEVESVLNKEDIPLNYRKYIKDYFISIGMRKEHLNDASK